MNGLKTVYIIQVQINTLKRTLQIAPQYTKEAIMLVQIAHVFLFSQWTDGRSGLKLSRTGKKITPITSSSNSQRSLPCSKDIRKQSYLRSSAALWEDLFGAALENEINNNTFRCQCYKTIHNIKTNKLNLSCSHSHVELPVSMCKAAGISRENPQTQGAHAKSTQNHHTRIEPTTFLTLSTSANHYTTVLLYKRQFHKHEWLTDELRHEHYLWLAVLFDAVSQLHFALRRKNKQMKRQTPSSTFSCWW